MIELKPQLASNSSVEAKTNGAQKIVPTRNGCSGGCPVADNSDNKEGRRGRASTATMGQAPKEKWQPNRLKVLGDESLIVIAWRDESAMLSKSNIAQPNAYGGNQVRAESLAAEEIRLQSSALLYSMELGNMRLTGNVQCLEALDFFCNLSLNIRSIYE